jgi:hypothetical protein
MASIPLPRYPADGFAGRRWEGVDPRAMWLPLMWLPTRVALPYLTEDPSLGKAVFEAPDEWAARVALELSASGLYDPETGRWVDVLALHGIDITDEDSVERVGSWLAGSDDPVLDGIDLSDRFTRPDPDEEHWAAEAVEAMGTPLLQSRFALLASDVCEIFDDIANPDTYSNDDLSAVRVLASHVLEMAELELSALGEAPLKALDLGVSTTKGMQEMWRSHIAAVTDSDATTLDEFLAEAITPAAEVAARMRNLFSRDYEQVNAWLSGAERIPGIRYDEEDTAAPAEDGHEPGSEMRMSPGQAR